MLAVFGELHPGLVQALDLVAPLVAFELDLDTVPLPKPRASKARAGLDEFLAREGV